MVGHTVPTHQPWDFNSPNVPPASPKSVTHCGGRAPAPQGPATYAVRGKCHWEWRCRTILNVLLAMEGHEVERELLEAIGPLIIQFQLVLQAPASELRQHDFGQADVVDLKAAPQRAHSLHAQVQCILADKRGLPTACWAWYKDNKEKLAGGDDLTHPECVGGLFRGGSTREQSKRSPTAALTP